MVEPRGVPLERFMVELRGRGETLPGSQVWAWGMELAEALRTARTRECSLASLEPSEILVRNRGSLRVPRENTAKPGPGGWFGMKRGRRDSGRGRDEESARRVAELLFFVATGADPEAAVRLYGRMEQPVACLNPRLALPLDPVLRPYLQRTTSRPPACDLYAALAAMKEPFDRDSPAWGALAGDLPEEAARARSAEIALRLGYGLCDAAEPACAGEGLVWPSTSRSGREREVFVGLYRGCSGVVLALAELMAAIPDPRLEETLAGAALTLASPYGAQALGLYHGAAGGGLGLLRAGQALRSEDFVSSALSIGSFLGGRRYLDTNLFPGETHAFGPDLFSGAAGRLRLHLWLWKASDEAEQLKAAQQAGEALLKMAVDIGHGELCWPVSPSRSQIELRQYLGYAHGAAGIGDALLDLWEAGGDERMRDGARGAARWLRRLAMPVPGDENGVAWPREEGDGPTAPFWCHGAAGIGRFFLHAARLDLLPGARYMMQRAAYSAARYVRGACPAQCHGLAGNIEFLLDVYRFTGDTATLNEARSLAMILEGYLLESQAKEGGDVPRGAAGVPGRRSGWWSKPDEPSESPEGLKIPRWEACSHEVLRTGTGGISSMSNFNARDAVPAGDPTTDATSPVGGSPAASTALVCSSEMAGVITPDYGVGFAGVALCFLRLSDPERFPHALCCCSA